MTDAAPEIAAYLADLPDDRWGDLDGLAGTLIAAWPDAPMHSLERGISLSLALARARLSSAPSATQARIETARAEGGSRVAAELIAATWASHNAHRKETT